MTRDGGEVTGATAILSAIAGKLHCSIYDIERELNLVLRPAKLAPLAEWNRREEAGIRLLRIRQGVGTPLGTDVLTHIFSLIKICGKHRYDGDDE
jgi:hypothetical protein